MIGSTMLQDVLQHLLMDNAIANRIGYDNFTLYCQTLTT